MLAGLVLSAVLLTGVRPALAAENIASFEARVSVSKDATIEVTERIVYDFGNDQRHGIFRVIPYSYQAGTETYTADVTSVLVTDGEGAPLPFTESRDSGELTLKIGDPDEYVTGAHTYVINYMVEGPFLYFDDRDEFYWNVTGVWPTGIDRAQVLVELPPGEPVLDAACYAGKEGTSQTCESDQRLVGEERAAYTATAVDLAPNEGFSIAVAFPAGTVRKIEQPWQEEHTWQPVTLAELPLFWPVSIPVVVLISMGYIWYRRGRDPVRVGSIVTEFAPPKGLSPGVAGVVYNGSVENREISAEVVRLATEGFIRIHRIEEKILWVFDVTDYVFEFTDASKHEADEVELLILEKLRQPEFAGSKTIEGRDVHGALLSKMKQQFTKEKKEIEQKLYDEVLSRRYFVARPDKVRTTYVLAGIGILGLSILSFMFVDSLHAALLVGSGVVSGFIVGIIGIWMPARTHEGVRVLRHLKGFEQYLSVAEKDRLAFHNAPEKKPELFDRYLPYAIAFGVESAWAEQFEGIYTEPPQWYSGGGSFAHGFALGALTSDLSSFSHDFAAAAAPQSSGSSGGGSVGGGFGGGGGGSW